MTTRTLRNKIAGILATPLDFLIRYSGSGRSIWAIRISTDHVVVAAVGVEDQREAGGADLAAERFSILEKNSIDCPV